MEHKAWLWKRKSSEQEKEKASEMERYVEELKEQLTSARIESNAKDDVVAKQIKEAKDAIAGREKAEKNVESIKKELANALLQKEASEEKIGTLESTIKECVKQLHYFKEEHQHIIADAATKISKAKELLMENRLMESNNKISTLAVENSNLRKFLEAKEKLIEDLTKSKSQTESRFTDLITVQDSLDKDNVSLKYEVHMLQKELEIRNQDRDFHVKSADASHKQYLESVKKITRLESECQRLRVMVRKRLPGPAAISKMKNEVEILDNVSTGLARKKQNLAIDNHDSQNRKIASLVERLNAVEDENKILKEALVKKNNELLSTKTKFEEVSIIQVKEDEDNNSCSGSWASALISELEHFKNGKMVGVSELSLMDDFIEMEKLAIVCVDKQSENSTIKLAETSKQTYCSDLEKPLCKIIEMIEQIIQNSFTNNIGQQILGEKGDKAISTGKHVTHAFQWIIADLCSVLQQFIVVCNDLLHGKADFIKFTCELGLCLEWIFKHCYSLQDLNAESNVENEFDHKKFRDLESKNELLNTQLKESDLRICNLEEELLTLKCSKSLIEDQIENQKLIAEDLCTQLTVANAELNTTRKKLSSLEVEFEDKINCCEELEATCLELQLQLESMPTKGTPRFDKGQEETQLRKDWEISEASEKLAECQATILNLGKQLKSLASPKDAHVIEKLMSPSITGSNLLDKMHAEDGAIISEYQKSPKTKEIICTSENNPNAGMLYGRKLNRSNAVTSVPSPMDSYEPDKQRSESSGGKLVLVTKRRRGTSFWKKLLSRTKKVSTKKKALAAAT